MAQGKFVSYLRVSTQRQGASGLGLESQRETINQYLNGGEWELLKEYQEVESGKNNDRPSLNEALEYCGLTGATLLVAKLDRLSRDLHFITSLEKAGVKFVVCDFPAANQFTLHIFAALAQYERELISQRTTSALAAKKARGEKLGKPENLTAAAALKGQRLASVARSNKADMFAVKVLPKMSEYRLQGLGLSRIADRLNEEHILTARGKAGTWTATAVRNVLARG